MLEELERDNLFVVPLDAQRSWYRYHHLFADVLHARLLAEHPDEVPDLHRRASAWYAAHDLARPTPSGTPSPREDFDRAAHLMEEALAGAAPRPAGRPAAGLDAVAARGRGAPEPGPQHLVAPGRC